VGAGLPLWLPKGTALRERLVNFMKKAQEEGGYQQVATPAHRSKGLYETSGHWEKYGKDSFQPISTPQEGEQFMLKPMNCPHHCEIFASRPRSYKDLPIRLAEFGTVYRYEQSGELHGLARVRGFTQDDAHLFCRPDQVKEEFKKVIDLVLLVFKALDFTNFEAQVSLRDKEDRSKYIGSDENWEKAETGHHRRGGREGLEDGGGIRRGRVLRSQAGLHGEGRLGPQVAVGHHPGGLQPSRALRAGIRGQRQPEAPSGDDPPGALRQLGALHRGGHRAYRRAFPLWLTPEQAVVLPISDKYRGCLHRRRPCAESSDIRASVDERNEKIGRKIRDAELAKIPFMLIIGEKEAADGTVSVREHGQGDLGTMTPQAFAELVNARITAQFGA
jgi:threonyl-tRNA synthetase